MFLFRDVEGLKRACIRHVKAQTLLDLTPCRSWIRFCDVHYRRLDDDGHECEEVTVIFLIDVSELIPSAEEWPAIWKEQNEWKKRAAQADILPVSILHQTKLCDMCLLSRRPPHRTMPRRRRRMERTWKKRQKRKKPRKMPTLFRQCMQRTRR